MRCVLASITCLLVLLVAIPAGARRPDSGVSGRVFIGPTCPVERPGGECADRPYATTIRILRRRSHRRAATVTSRRDGRFLVRLAPGAYLVEGVEPRARIPRAPEPEPVRVVAHRFARVVLSYDSGIR